MKKFLVILLFCHCALSAYDFESLAYEQNIVVSTKRITLKNFLHAYNPSIFKAEQGYLLAFRYLPIPDLKPWINYIGVVLLNDAFEPISEPELLNARPKNSKTPSQAEDARIFSYKGRLFLIYNDNLEIEHPGTWQRRDIFIAELLCADNHYSLSPPLKLFYEEKYNTQRWQKNWIPFEYNSQLLFIYSVNPHEILYPNLMSGACYHCYDSYADISWEFGPLRGSTPPQLIDGEYLAFFHSGIVTSSVSSWGWDIWHYFMGAYTFSAEPPFHITKISSVPIVADGFYTPSSAEKRVIFPGGFIVSDPYIYVVYGKDDREMWVATLDKEALKRSLIPVENP